MKILKDRQKILMWKTEVNNAYSCTAESQGWGDWMSAETKASQYPLFFKSLSREGVMRSQKSQMFLVTSCNHHQSILQRPEETSQFSPSQCRLRYRCIPASFLDHH